MNAGLIVFGVVLSWTVVALLVLLGCWIGFQLVQQNGRLLSRLETLDQRLGQLSSVLNHAPTPQPPPAPAPSGPSGLAIGSPAPEFALSDLSGGHQSLSHFRGRKVLLVFFNPRCGFCTRMAPDLSALPPDGADGRPVPLVVTTGGADENRKLVEEHGIRCPVLLQEPGTHGVGGEVASQYQASGTPMGYLIDEQGSVMSELAVGAQALLALMTRGSAVPANGSGPAAPGGKRSVERSQIDQPKTKRRR